MTTIAPWLSVPDAAAAVRFSRAGLREPRWETDRERMDSFR